MESAESLRAERPAFPKRAVVTAGMPYGNKALHMGHIGGVFVHADTYARFLRDRLGPENVIFVSGTDCYGSPAFEHHRQLVSNGLFDGTVGEFVAENHLKQKEAPGRLRDRHQPVRGVRPGPRRGDPPGCHRGIHHTTVCARMPEEADDAAVLRRGSRRLAQRPPGGGPVPRVRGEGVRRRVLKRPSVHAGHAA